MLYEWRSQVARFGPPKLAEQKPEGAQFRSVFGFPRETANIIERQQSMKNLNGKMLYSDTILVDVDNEAHVDKVVDILNGLHVNYQVCDTGNRGRHFHIPIEPLEGVNVVYSIKHWLQSVGLWPLIDTSIYRPAGQFRAVGAVHRKTGRVKRVTDNVEGRKPALKMLTPPPITKPLWQLEEGTPDTIFNFFMNILAERDCGQRHPHLYIIFKSGQSAGYSREEVEECAHWWNQVWTTVPHSYEAVERKLKGMR